MPSQTSVSIFIVANGIGIPTTGFAYAASGLISDTCVSIPFLDSMFNMTAGNEYTVTVSVDPSQEIVESDETNNVADVSLMVP